MTPRLLLTPWRCPSCGHLLAEVDMAQGGTLRVKCKNCKQMCTLEVRLLEPPPLARATIKLDGL